MSDFCAGPVECLPNGIPPCGPPSEDSTGRGLLLWGQAQILIPLIAGLILEIIYNLGFGPGFLFPQNPTLALTINKY